MRLPVFGIKPGVSEVHWDSWPRIDEAIASYEVFTALRAAGVIGPGTRFQHAGVVRSVRGSG
jgi:hypothetical protein